MNKSIRELNEDVIIQTLKQTRISAGQSERGRDIKICRERNVAGRMLSGGKEKKN